VKLAVFDDYRIGVVVGDVVSDVTHVLPDALNAVPEARMNWLIANWADVADELTTDAGDTRPVSAVTLRACSPSPSGVFALPGNYAAHLGEIGRMTVSGKRTANEMGFFLKAPASVIGPGEAIRLPKGSDRRFDHECELAAVIGAAAFEVPATQAADVVFGYTCAVDVTMRIDPDGRQEDRSMRKSFAGFTPIGPYLVTADEIGDPHTLSSRLSVNGQQRQSAQTSAMIVDVWQAIEIISSVVALRPGDVVLTGTPEGVGPIVPGDCLEIAIDRIGAMTLAIEERSAISPRTF
jgi:2-keto-4-pentenoate hydratase/2-oxohepta-3-ene-1,7-dioic acid hydratase in catechol pathway